MELSTKVSGTWKLAIVKVVVPKSGAMAPSLLVTGRMIKLMVKAA